MKIQVILLWLAAVSSISSAQIVSGSISGAVTDSSGSLIPAANVTLVRTSTAQARTTVSDESGNFQFGGLEPGEYKLRASKDGFKAVEQSGIILTTGQRLAL